MSNLRYFDAAAAKKPAPLPKVAVHTEFLRTGRINRNQQMWSAEEKRYLTHQDVAVRTGRKLEAAATVTHGRINGFHRSIRFPKLFFHRTLADSPHLGYCHVTAAHTKFAQFDDVRWSFYIANFFSDIGDDEHFFEKIKLGYSRMYFAVATEVDADAGKLTVNRAIHENGLLFRTRDPKEALKNVLLLGARNEQLRKIINSL
ncbi:hypothetical protein ADU59_24345 [Pararhizobium polonicum]|uniref:Uncharacterized protein n=1 Tax=Pararhizobium polonicum TaxID=1612624 RepID=A0A1C7NV34_9HYPH|nr:DUF6656 family protein [Pararhizobium polonicum]OBZ92860.1 hypothetical protein ADU59_24345 [Pararhizobium polonicum]